MAHGDAREGKWRGNWRMEWVASTLHTTSERGVSSITNADAHTSAASSRLKWRLRRFKWTRPFRRKTKSGFCACAITFQTQSTFRGLQCSSYSIPSEHRAIFLTELIFTPRVKRSSFYASGITVTMHHTEAYDWTQCWRKCMQNHWQWWA